MSMTSLIEIVSGWSVPIMVGFIPLFGWLRGVDIYETFTEGAKEGFKLSIRMIPFLVAILMALNIFQDSGAMDWVIHHISGPL
ncbi:MAG: spore maturation protein, partial [Firmicutes bacterium]|nr:spore maturation protein [Bacillota bacterium]